MSVPVRDDPSLLSARRAALLAGVDERELRRRIQRGELAAVKDGGTWRISLADLEAAGLTLRPDAAGAAALEARARAADREAVTLRARCEELTRELAEARRTLGLQNARP